MRCVLALLVLFSAGLVHAQAPAPGDVVVNEIMYDPLSTTSCSSTGYLKQAG